MEYLNLIIIALIGILTNFFTAISGGAALIYIPLLMFLGLPPSVAIATNRFSALGTFTELYKFVKEGKVLYKLAFPLVIFATLGSFIGANLLLRIDEIILQRMVAIFIILIVLLLIFKKDIGLKKKIVQISIKKKITGYILGFLIGVYAGFFGAASVTFFSFLLIFIFGLTFLESAGTRALIFLFIIIVTTIVFVFAGQVNFLYGGALLIGRAIGSYFGASFAVKRGEKYTKIVFIIIALIFGIKLLI